MAGRHEDETGLITGVWEPRLRVDEELEFFTELALHETERWIQAVTRKKLSHPDDPRKSLENGILLCELLNCLKPGSVRKINRLPTPIAFLDNLHVFLEACGKHFNLRESQLFDACDLEDLSTRAISESEDQLKYETERRLRNVAITIFWLGKVARGFYDGPHLDLTAFADLVNQQVAPHEASRPDTSHFRQESSDSATESQCSEAAPALSQHERQASADSLDYSSAYGSYRSSEATKSSQSSVHLEGEEEEEADPREATVAGPARQPRHHVRDNSYDSLISEEPGAGEDRSHHHHHHHHRPTAHIDGGGDVIDGVLFTASAESAGDPQSRSGGDYLGQKETMPVRYDDQRRHSSYVKPAELRYSATFDSVYDGSDSDSSRREREQYRSTPSLNNSNDGSGVGGSGAGSGVGGSGESGLRYGSQEAMSTRSESIDSLDNSSRRSDHSRQSSGSGDFSLSNRMGGGQYRRSSTTSATGAKPAANPLQFIQASKDNPLVEKAKETVEVMEKQKKEKKIIQSGEDDWQSKARMPEDDSGDWVSNLSAWKSKMRKKSASTYVRAVEADEVSKKQDEDPTQGSRRNKTFKEMMAEKERRKSSSFNIYPYGDDEDDSAVAATKPVAAKSEEQPKQPVEAVDEFGFIRVKRNPETREEKINKWRGSSSLSTDDSKASGDKFSKWKSLEKESVTETNSSAPTKKWQSQGRGTFDSDSKPTRWKSQESVTTEDRFSKWRQREKEGQAGTESARETSPAFKSEIPKEDRFSRWRQAERDSSKDDGYRPPASRRTKTEDPAEDIAPWARSSPEGKSTTTDSNDDRAVTSASPTTPRDSWRRRLDVGSAGGKQNEGADLRQESSVTTRLGRFRAEESSGNTREDTDLQQKRRSGTVEAPAPDIHDNHTEDGTSTLSSTSSGWENLPSAGTEADSDQRVLERPSDVPRVRQDDSKGTYVEKSVRVNAKPERSRGFGFTIKGGKEDGTPITIEKVSRGSPADVCELMAGDEIVSINGVDVARHYKESVMHVVDQAAQTGQLDLRIRRYLSTAYKRYMTYRRKPKGPEEEEVDEIEERREEVQEKAPEHQRNQVAPPTSESAESADESFDSEDEALEQRIMEQLEQEAEAEAAAEAEADLLHHMSMHEDDLARQESFQEEIDSMDQQEHKTDEEEEEEEEEDEDEEEQRSEDEDQPPPIPSEPPPAPNWNTFPSASRPAADVDDFGDILPDDAAPPEAGRVRGVLSSDLDTPNATPEGGMESAMRIRVDGLRRRSEYLGIRLEDMEEYKKIQDEAEREAQKIAEREEDARKSAEHRRRVTEKKEEDTWRQIERRRSPSGSKPVKPTDALWQQIEASSRDADDGPAKMTTFGTGTYGYKPEYDLEKAEREIIENLEREEKMNKSKTFGLEADNKDTGRKPWQSSEKPLSGFGVNEVEARVMQDMESTLKSRPEQEKTVMSSMRFFDFEADQKRMEDWGRENERRIKPDETATFKVETQINLQEQFERDQEDMRRLYEEEQRQTELIREEKRREEQALMEKEKAHQRELEAMRLKQEEERERRRAQEEARRRREEAEQEERRRRDEAERERVRQVEAEKERVRREEAERERREEAELQRQRREESEREKRQREAEQRRREMEAEEERRRQEEAELQKKLARQKIHIERDQASHRKPHGEYTFTFSVDNRSPSEGLRTGWQRDSSQERQQRDDRGSEERASIQSQRDRVRQLEAEKQEREHQAAQEKWELEQQRAAQELSEREQKIKEMEDRIKRESDELKAQRALLVQKGHQSDSRDVSRRYRNTSPDSSSSSLIAGYPYRPQEAPVSELSNYTSPVNTNVPQLGFGSSEQLARGGNEYSRPQMEPGYGYKELSHSLQDVRIQEKNADSRPHFKVEIGSLDPSRRVVVDRTSTSPSRDPGFYSEDIQRSVAAPTESAASYPRAQTSHHEPLWSGSPQTSLSGETIVARRDVMEKRPSRHYSPEPARGMPPTSRSMDEITVTRSAIDWNKRPSHAGPTARHEESVHRHSLSADTTALNPRVTRLNQRPVVPRPDDYWMRESNNAAPRARQSPGSSREDLRNSRKSWQEDSQDSAYRSRSDSNSSSSRRSLHNLGATPKQKIISGNDWIVSDEERRRQEKQQRVNRHSEIMRQHVTNTSDHWLVEEAERRRKAERSGQDRHGNIQSRQNDGPDAPASGYWRAEDGDGGGGGGGPYRPIDADSQSALSYRALDDSLPPPASSAASSYVGAGHSGYYRSPTHITEHTEAPVPDRPRPARPIPEEIKQTLIQRVATGKQPAGRTSGQGPPSPNQSYYHNPQQSTYHQPPPAHSPSSQYQQAHPMYQEDFYNQNNANAYTAGQSTAYPTYQEANANPLPPVKPPRAHHQTTPQSDSPEHPHAEVVSVSGYQKCAHCEEDLGHGAAMIIESLNLYYHVQCFRCCVCHVPLGTGHKGADVRVRVTKLHCQNCYSNDEVGLKYSRV